MALYATTAAAQQVAAASSGRIGSVAQSAGGGSIARGVSGERVGSGQFVISEEKPRVVSGKMAGYGIRMVPGSTGEAVFNAHSTGFGGSSDFPQSDFVATMPGPPLVGGGAAPSSLPGSGFGITSSAPAGGGGRNASAGTTRISKTTPRHQIKEPDSILNPFTHSIGGTLGAPSGSLPTVLGAGPNH
jgi:hypothetical protein